MTRISEIARIVVKDAPFESGSMEESAWLVWKSMREEAIAKLDRRVHGALATERYDGRHGAGYKMRGTMVYHFEKLFPQLLIQGEKARVEFTKPIALFLRDTGNAECLSKSSKPPVWFVRDVFEASRGVVLRLPYQPTEMERKLTPQEAGETREPGQVTTTGRQAPPISQDVPTVVPAEPVDYAGPEFPFPNPELVWCLGEIDPHQPLPDAEKEAEAHRHLANNEMFKNRTIAHTRTFLVQRTRSAVRSSMTTQRAIRDVLLGAERPLMAKEIAARRGKPGSSPSPLFNRVWLPAGLVRETTGKAMDRLWVWANRSECAPNQYTRPYTEPPIPQRGGARGSKKATPTPTETVKEEPTMGAADNSPEQHIFESHRLPSGRILEPEKNVRPMATTRQRIYDGIVHQWRSAGDVAFHAGRVDTSTVLREALYLEHEKRIEVKKGDRGRWLIRWRAEPALTPAAPLSLDGLSDYPEITAFVQDTAIAMIVTIETVAKRLAAEAAAGISYDDERVAKLEATVSNLTTQLEHATTALDAMSALKALRGGQ